MKDDAPEPMPQGTERRALLFARRAAARPPRLKPRFRPRARVSFSSCPPAAPAAGSETLVAIRNRTEAPIANVCVVVEGIVHAPRGAVVLAPGATSSLVEVAPLGIAEAAIYFELDFGDQHVPLLTRGLFEVRPGAVQILTLFDRTAICSPPLALEHLVHALTDLPRSL